MLKKDVDGFLCNSSAICLLSSIPFCLQKSMESSTKISYLNQNQFDCIQGSQWSIEALINVDRVQMAMIFQVQLEFVGITVGSNVSLHVS